MHDIKSIHLKYIIPIIPKSKTVEDEINHDSLDKREYTIAYNKVMRNIQKRQKKSKSQLMNVIIDEKIISKVTTEDFFEMSDFYVAIFLKCNKAISRNRKMLSKTSSK